MKKFKKKKKKNYIGTIFDNFFPNLGKSKSSWKKISPSFYYRAKNQKKLTSHS